MADPLHSSVHTIDISCAFAGCPKVKPNSREFLSPTSHGVPASEQLNLAANMAAVMPGGVWPPARAGFRLYVIALGDRKVHVQVIDDPAEALKLSKSHFKSIMKTVPWASIVWLDFQGADAHQIQVAGEVVGLHPLTVEDITADVPVEKVEAFAAEGYIFSSIWCPEGGAMDPQAPMSVLHLVCSPRVAVTFHRVPLPISLYGILKRIWSGGYFEYCVAVFNADSCSEAAKDTRYLFRPDAPSLFGQRRGPRLGRARVGTGAGAFGCLLMNHFGPGEAEHVKSTNSLGHREHRERHMAGAPTDEPFRSTDSSHPATPSIPAPPAVPAEIPQPASAALQQPPQFDSTATSPVGASQPMDTIGISPGATATGATDGAVSSRRVQSVANSMPPISMRSVSAPLVTEIPPDQGGMFRAPPLQDIIDEQHGPSSSSSSSSSSTEAAENMPSSLWLFYVTLDVCVDVLMSAVDHLSDEVETLGDITCVSAEVTSERHVVFKRIDYKRRSISTLRRVVSSKQRLLVRMYTSNMKARQPELYLHFRDVGDHLGRMLEKVDTTRDVLNHSSSNFLGLVNIEMAALSASTAERMKTMSIIGALFLPFTLVTGLFGMNVDVPWQTGQTGKSESRSLAPFFGIVAAIVGLGAIAIVVAFAFYLKSTKYCSVCTKVALKHRFVHTRAIPSEHLPPSHTLKHSVAPSTFNNGVQISRTEVGPPFYNATPTSPQTRYLSPTLH